MAKSSKSGKSIKDAKMPNIKAPHIGPRPRKVGPIGGSTGPRRPSADKVRTSRKK